MSHHALSNTQNAPVQNSPVHPPALINRPTVAVGTVVVRGNQILLIKRGKEPNKGAWSIPGGRQEAGETVRETAAREVFEETGITIKDITLLDTLDLIERNDTGQVSRHYTLIDFCAYATDDTIPKAGDDAVDAEFVPLQDAIARVTWDETKRIIREAAHIFGQNNHQDPEL